MGERGYFVRVTLILNYDIFSSLHMVSDDLNDKTFHLSSFSTCRVKVVLFF